MIGEWGHHGVPAPGATCEVGGAVAVLWRFGDGRFALQKVHLVQAFGDDGMTPAIVVAARKESGARGATRSSG